MQRVDAKMIGRPFVPFPMSTNTTASVDAVTDRESIHLKTRSGATARRLLHSRDGFVFFLSFLTTSTKARRRIDQAIDTDRLRHVMSCTFKCNLL